MSNVLFYYNNQSFSVAISNSNCQKNHQQEWIDNLSKDHHVEDLVWSYANSQNLCWGSKTFVATHSSSIF